MKDRFVIAVLCIVVLFTGCSKKYTVIDCEYKKSQTNILGTNWGIEDSDLTEVVNKNHVTVTNQKTMISEYKITLTDFFYDKNTDLIVYKLIISDKNDKKLSKKQRKNFQNMLDMGELEFIFDSISYANCSCELKTDEVGNTIYINAVLLASIIANDSVKKIANKPVSLLNIEYQNNIVYKFSLPDFTFKSETVFANLSKNSNVLRLNISEYGIDIIWNTKKIIQKYKIKLKKLSKQKGFNEENYGYSIFHNISLTLKDGTTYPLTGENKLNVLYDDSEEYEQNYLYNYHIIFKSKILLSQVKYISIDGNKCSLLAKN